MHPWAVRVRRLAGLLALLAGLAQGMPAGTLDAAPDAAAGARIYLDGILPSGAPLQARRENETRVQGATAACVSCHRRSGLGNVEGQSVVPPITTKYLMRSALENGSDFDMSHVEGFHQGHVPYTDETLAHALREGQAADGRTMSGLMPRYELDAAAMADLIAYLHGLGAGPFPGVSETQLQFATIITPDADPVERQAMLEVMQRFFKGQADVIAAETRPLRTSREIKYRVTRQWRLHVWELSGPPQGWQEQLESLQRTQPVFAVISGLGRATWAPVHRFCEAAHLPCLFPNVDLPVVREQDFYPVYFSRGVLLEADLLAQWLAAHPGPGSGGRLLQVARAGDVGSEAAPALAAALSARYAQRALRLAPAAAPPVPSWWAETLQGLGPADTLVLWMRPQDLRSLPAEPPKAGTILLSGLMGGMESAPLPPAWRARVHMSYPEDLPERRLARMNFPFGWLRVQQLPLTAERVQVNTYLACVIASETLGHMLDSFVPEYLIERLEMMISRRLANAYFPRLGLAPGQRFASKGGYVVHFDPQGAGVPLPATATAAQAPATSVVADTDWIVP